MKRHCLFLIPLFMVIGLVIPVFSLNDGDTAPLVRLKDKDGKTFDSCMVVKKKPVVVSFFNRPCPPCLKEIPFLQSLKQKYGNVEFVLICPPKDLDLKTMTLNEGLEFIKAIENSSKTTIELRVLYDKFFSAIKSYNVKEFPSTFLIGKDGKILHHIVGYKGDNGVVLENMIKALGDPKK